MTRARIASLVKKKIGVLLDVSRGGTPQDGSLTFAELGHDPRVLPWPLPAGCVHTAVVTHVLEYLPPEHFFAWFDELHRVMRRGGIVHLSGPYGGEDAVGWVSDPEHRTRVVEATFAWFDPRSPIFALHELHIGRSQPRPWNVLAAARVPGTLGTISYNVTLRAADLPKRQPTAAPEAHSPQPRAKSKKRR